MLIHLNTSESGIMKHDLILCYLMLYCFIPYHIIPRYVFVAHLVTNDTVSFHLTNLLIMLAFVLLHHMSFLQRIAFKCAKPTPSHCSCEHLPGLLHEAVSLSGSRLARQSQHTPVRQDVCCVFSMCVCVKLFSHICLSGGCQS